MTAPTPNAELAYRVLDLARANGDSFEMGSWAWSLDGEPVGLDDLTKHDCGTTACLAGWTAAVMGYKVDSAAFVFDSGGNELSQDAALFAARILGIDDVEAARLFYASDSQVDRVVAEIFGPRPDGGEGGSVCRCDWLGAGTPEHAPSPLCRSLRPDADRDEMQPPPCADHQSSELGCPVCTAQRRAFYAALGREDGGEGGSLTGGCPNCPPGYDCERGHYYTGGES